MSEVRLNFLNWRPDLEALGNDGLTVAENVLHDAEGFKKITEQTAGAFSTTTASVTDFKAVAIGTNNQTFCCWLSGGTMFFGIDGVTATGPSTATAFATATAGQAISSFAVTEYGDDIFFCAVAEGTTAIPATLVSIGFSGYLPDAV